MVGSFLRHPVRLQKIIEILFFFFFFFRRVLQKFGFLQVRACRTAEPTLQGESRERVKGISRGFSYADKRTKAGRSAIGWFTSSWQTQPWSFQLRQAKIRPFFRLPNFPENVSSGLQPRLSRVIELDNNMWELCAHAFGT